MEFKNFFITVLYFLNGILRTFFPLFSNLILQVYFYLFIYFSIEYSRIFFFFFFNGIFQIFSDGI